MPFYVTISIGYVIYYIYLHVIFINLYITYISSYILIYLYATYISFDRVCRVFANRPVDLGSIPGRVLPKTLKMVLDTSLLNIQRCKVRVKGKVK